MNSWIINDYMCQNYILGIFITGFMLFGSSCYFTYNQSIISKLDDIDEYYIAYSNISTGNTLRCIPESCDFRQLKPDEGTIGVWMFDHNEKEGPQWNLIMTDDLNQFIKGVKQICNTFNVNVKDYILGEPMQSEGGVENWNIIDDPSINYNIY